MLIYEVGFVNREIGCNSNLPTKIVLRPPPKALIPYIPQVFVFNWIVSELDEL